MQDNISIYFKHLRTHIDSIIDLNEEEFNYLISLFSLNPVAKREYLLQPLQICRYESYIVKGLFQTSVTNDSGKEHILYFPHESWWVGDFKSFETEQESQMTIKALEDSVLLQISKRALEELYKNLPIVERFFRILNGNSSIALQDRLLNQFMQNSDKKYLDFKSKYPGLHNRLSNKQVAQYLGLTPEYFSLMLKNL